ncbi:STAS domain-containing protein [Actinophytocola sp. NPDC049390]|uniref:STAS domain-containing protein n=1 Tax=Actinophytocola sp. NPDC049390 TaxID=3363894 RepID=UPI0037885C5F
MRPLLQETTLADLSSLRIRHRLVTTGVVVVSVGGEVDLATVDTLRDNLTPHVSDPATRLLVCDLSQVGFLACSGLSALLDVRSELEARGARFAVVANSPAVLRPVTITGLPEALGVHPSLSAVLRQSIVE